ncbi:unnamed protein product [Cercospora beticola]|nr:unnamed protein product [Cercospora beticola]
MRSDVPHMNVRVRVTKNADQTTLAIPCRLVRRMTSLPLALIDRGTATTMDPTIILHSRPKTPDVRKLDLALIVHVNKSRDLSHPVMHARVSLNLVLSARVTAITSDRTTSRAVKNIVLALIVRVKKNLVPAITSPGLVHTAHATTTTVNLGLTTHAEKSRDPIAHAKKTLDQTLLNQKTEHLEPQPTTKPLLRPTATTNRPHPPGLTPNNKPHPEPPDNPPNTPQASTS